MSPTKSERVFVLYVCPECGHYVTRDVLGWCPKWDTHPAGREKTTMQRVGVSA